MKIKFEANQQYQLDAIQGAVDIFDGQPLASGAFEIHYNAAGGELFTELGTGNCLELQAEQVLANLNTRVRQIKLQVIDYARNA